MVLRKFFSGVLIFTCSFFYAQVVFTELPAGLQLIPRTTASSGSFKVAGKCTGKPYLHIKSRLVETLNPSVVLEEKICSPDAAFLFTIQHTLPAQLKEYDLKIYGSDGIYDTLVKTVKRLVCGDYFIISGQSNALAADNYTDSSYTEPWLRGIGTHDIPFDRYYPCSKQLMDYQPATSFWSRPGFTGTWGMKLQHDLAEYTGIPSCFINGAKAGSSIDENLASHTPSDPERLDSCIAYDRLFKRTAYHHVNTAVKALFWYQGETDGGFSTDSACDYMNKFDRLYTSWKADYPALEKIFLVQVNTGCTEKNLALLREIQRKISYKYEDIVIMSAFSADTADRTPDGCHSTLKGYYKLADKLLPLVKKYIYKAALEDDNILPPKITRAYYSAASQICLEFDKAISVEQLKEYKDGATAYIKDYFYGEKSEKLNLLSVSAKENRAYLNFPETALLPAYVTYLPDSYTLLPTLYTGPWIVNKNNPQLTALSFYNYPVAPSNDPKWIVNNPWTCEKATVTYNDFLVYPNPAKDKITVSLYRPHPNTTISMIDTQGKIQLMLKNQDTTLSNIDVSALQKGMYLLKLDNAQGSFLKKIVLE